MSCGQPASAGAVAAKKCGGHFRHWHGGDFLTTPIRALGADLILGARRGCRR